MNFERGQDPHESLKIGKYRDIKDIKPGERLPIEFRLRLSCPEYYPLQRQKNIWATVIRTQFGSIKCRIKDVEGYFYAIYDKNKKVWAIESFSD